MDDIPDRETLEAWAEKHDIGRREALIGIGGLLGTGWLSKDQLPTSRNTDSRLSDGEDSAASVAARIDGTDLRDPLFISGLVPMVESCIETLSTVLQDGTVTHGVNIAEQQRQVAQALSVLPGVASPPAQSRPAKRMARLEGVLAYYQSLNQVLQHLASTQSALHAIEPAALYEGERPEHLSNIVDVEAIEAINKEAQSTGVRAIEGGSGSPLVPDIEKVTSDLGTQAKIQNQHSVAIEAYLATGERFGTGARQHEVGEFDSAKDRFRAAIEAIPSAVIESDYAYAISMHGPTLAEYGTHFEKRRRGLDRLVDACESRIELATRNSRFDEGLSHLIDARGVIRG